MRWKRDEGVMDEEVKVENETDKRKKYVVKESRESSA